MSEPLKLYTVIGTYREPEGQRYATTVEAGSPEQAEVIASQWADGELVIAGVVKGSAELADVSYTDGTQELESEEPDNPAAELLHALTYAGIKRVTAEWYGSGDEGSVKSVELIDERGRTIGSGGDSGDGPEKALADEFQAWLETVIYEQSPGWEINEGGSGSLDFKVDSGVLRADHGNYAEPAVCPNPFIVDMRSGVVSVPPTWPQHSINEHGQENPYDRDLAVSVGLGELADAIDEAHKALCGDFNDAEHDALYALRYRLAEWFDDRNRRVGF